MNFKTGYQKEEKNQISRRLSPITKLSTPSRPFSRVKSVTNKRKKPWNKRFIYNKIPDYYSMKDENVINAKKLRMYSVKKKNIFDTNYITYQQSIMNQTKKNRIKQFNRTMSGFFSQYSRGINNYYTTKRNLISPLTNTAFNRNIFMKNSNLNINDENFNKIKKLWNELCVFPSYRELFIIIYNQISGEEKGQLFKNELNELITVKSDIKTLIYYIEQRNIVLRDLYDENIKLNKNKTEKHEDILIEISNLIEKIRESTIDVCYAMKKLKNDINNVNNLTKYNFDLLASKSKFDKNYLIKMKGELSFLKEGNAKYYFNLNDDRTPFLLKASEPNINMLNNLNLNNVNNDKDYYIRIVPLKEEIKDHINECNYYIYQELIAYQQNIVNQKKVFRYMSPLKSLDNKCNDISGNNLKNCGLNESLIKRKMNNNIYNDFSDINSVLSSNNIYGEKKLKNVRNIINQRLNARKNKDLFSQKLLSGYIQGEVENDFMIEDEKVKDEEEGEDEEKSENNTSKNELNDLIEEKKSETDNNEITKTNNNGEDKNSEDNKNSKNQEEEINNDKKVSVTHSEKNNISQESIKEINNNINKDIELYLKKDSLNFSANIDKKDDSNINEKENKSNNGKNLLNNEEIKHNEKMEENKIIEKAITNKEENNNVHKNKENIIDKEKKINEDLKEEEIKVNKNNNIEKNNNEDNKN